MFLDSKHCMLFLMVLTAPVVMLGQLPCPSSSGPALELAVVPGDIGPGEPFTVEAQVCPAPSSSVPVQFTASNLPVYPNTFTQTVPTDANGFVSIPISAGLPATPNGYPLSASVTSVGQTFYGSTTVYVGGGPAAGSLQGKYTFLVQGITGLTPAGAGLKAAVIGTFVADGQGGISSGEVDVNSGQGVATEVPITGRYTILSDLSGTITLNVAGSAYIGTLNLGGNIANPASPGVLPGGSISFAQGVIGSGSFALQASYPPGQNSVGGGGNAVIFGETACDATCVQGGGSAAPITAQFVVSEGGQIPRGPNGGAYPFFFQGTETVGTTSKPLYDYGLSAGKDSNGRELIGSDYVEYVIDLTHAYLMSIHPHSTADLLSGPVTVPQTPQ